MQTRKDHLHAYRFAVGRLATALVTGDATRSDAPMRRSSVGSFFSVGIALLLCVGFGVYGLIAPVPDQSWRASGSYIVEKETGNRYLYLGGVLRPIRNYSSLLLYTRNPIAHTVSRADVNGIPRGSAIGIPGAPDEVPAAAQVLGGDWTRCLRPQLTDGQSVDFGPAGLTTPIPADSQALLAAPDGARYVLWRGVKYPVPAQSTLVALGLDGDRQIAAPADWLAQLPSGRPLTAVLPAGLGTSVGEVAGRPVTVGQLFTTTMAGERSYYVMTRDGVARTNATESTLLAAVDGIPEPRDVSASALAAVRVSADRDLAGALPDVSGAPGVSTDSQAVCLAQHSDASAALTTQVVLERGAAATGNRRILVPPGHGLVVRSREQVLNKDSQPQTYLVTDDGTAYELAGDDVTAALGLSGSVSVLPSSVIALLPTGPVLAMPGSGSGGGANA
jgi:type VII secretion protein EccB